MEKKTTRSEIFILTLICTLFVFSSFGINFRKYDMGSGLSHNSVMCVTQSQDGFIWIGTRDGLCRFNGVSNTVYKQNFDDTNSISNNSINCLFEASDGKLWIGTTMGLNCYSPKTDRFEKFTLQADGKGISQNYIRAIIETNEGKILIGNPFGIDIYDPTTNAFEAIPIEKSNTLKDNIITCFFKDSNNRIWVGQRSGVYLFTNNSFERVCLDKKLESLFDKFEIRDIREDSNGTIWVATEEYGLYAFKYQSNQCEDFRNYTVSNSNIVSNHIRKIYIADDEIWIGTMDGLSIFSPTKGSFKNFQYSADDPDGISNNSIRDILGDNQGGIWLATYAGGVNYYHPQNNLFPHYKSTTEDTNFLTSNVISFFLEEKNGDLWIATEGGGLIFREFSKNKTNHYLNQKNRNSLVQNYVKSLAQDEKGNLWIGTFNGLSYFDRETGIFTNYLNDPEDQNSLIKNQVHSLFIDNQNLIWIGTNGGGLQTFNPASKQFKLILSDEVKNVNVIMADQKDRIWVGHQSGLACLDRLTGKKIDISSLLKQLPLSVQYVQCLFEDRLGRIWVGTQGFGLFLIHEEEIFWYNTEKGLPDNTVNAITEDAKGNFWLSTNQGVSKINLDDSIESSTKLKSKTYSKSQGIQGLQFLPNSILHSKSGLIYAGGVNGFNVFDPEKVDDRDFFPPIIFTDLRIRSNTKEGVKHWPVQNLTTSHRDLKLNYQFRDISVDFLGINYTDPENTYYRYQLLGIEKDWVYIAKQRTINFNYLPAGKYELRLQASTNESNWGDTYQSLSFEILRPWWLTGWAFAGYLLFLGLFLAIFFSLSKRWANLNNRLEMEQFQRTKEDELHQLKLKFFTDVSHELRTPLTLIVSPLEQIIQQPDLNSRLRNQLSLIQRNGNRMMRLINKVLDLRRLETGHEQLKAAPGDLVKFLTETSLAFKESATAKNIEFKFIPLEPTLEIYFDRDKMEMILYNLLSNAIKNTKQNGRITLELSVANTEQISRNKLQTESSYAEIRVSDNGRGIPSELLDRIFERFFVSQTRESRRSLDSGVGLELTKRLVELHKGIISVESRERTSEEDGFTCFSILFPMGKNHLSNDEIASDYKSSEDSSQYVKTIQEAEALDGAENEEIEELPTEFEQNSSETRLLIVEDNAEVRSFIKSLFTNQYLVEVAENGKIGLQMATENVPDLIVCDVMMPEMDGMELCKRIKTDVRTSHIPVILLTARTAITFKYEGLETGADDYITKPFSADYLKLRVRNLIRQREMIRNHFTRETIFDPAKITVTSVDERLLKKAVDYIGEHMTDASLSVEKLSSELGLSRVHLYRKIKALTNLTAVEFIRSIRLKRAAMLLQENKLNVNEVSYLVGFDDVDYFRRCFKQQFGVAPSEYTKANHTNVDTLIQ
ncbi:two-component regulator propeller domain-containing protein [Mangrovibacterium sp.]|uniref:two-component regulator propeller domain-containing protein n=1 Tax=Mangrovibacterium sp. TaxID=1961364 RepID=UPI003566A2B8